MGHGGRREAFAHLEENDGTWTDEAITFYSGKQTFPNYAGSLIHVPDAISNFFGAVDERVDSLNDSVSTYRRRGRSVYDKLEKARQIDSRAAWRQVGRS